MHTNEHKDDIHCRGREPDVGECDDTEATRVLRLSLADDQLESCGVRKFPQVGILTTKCNFVDNS